MLHLIIIWRLATCVQSKIRPAGENGVGSSMQAGSSHAHSCDCNGMNGGKVSLFHVFRTNVLTLHDVNSSRQDIRESRFSSNLNAICQLDSAWCIGLCIVCVHHDVNAYTCMSSFEFTTQWQCPFFAPGLCLTVVDFKFAVKPISQF
jgi:hypothetical protein